MSQAVSNRGSSDLAAAVRTLGLDADDLRSAKKAAKAIDKAKKRDAEAARAVEQALSSFSSEDLANVRNKLLGGSPRAGHVPSGGASSPIPASEPARTNTPEVAKLLAKYEPNGPAQVGRPAERILSTLAVIDGFIGQERDAEKLVDVALEKDLRRQVFLLEGQMRIYSNKFPEVTAHYKRAKELEDALGGASLYNGLVKIATAKQAPAEVIAHLQKEFETAKANAAKVLREHWMPEAEKRDQVPAINKMMKTLTKLDFGTYAEDREYLKSQIAGRADEVASTDYDLRNLEDGIHELRRDMRWITVFMEATNGLVQLGDEKAPIPELKPLLTSELAESKYAKLPGAEREPAPVVLPRTLYLANMDWVLKLGSIKDRGESLHYVADALLKTGLAKTQDEANERAVAILGDDHKTETFFKEADQIYADLKRMGFMAELRKAALEA